MAAFSFEEAGALRNYYAALKDKSSYDAFVRSAHELLQRIGAEPYHVRMTLHTGKEPNLDCGGADAKLSSGAAKEFMEFAKEERECE